MKPLLKFLIVCMASFVEIKVRASHLEEPRNCLQDNKECAVFAQLDRFKFNMGSAEIRLLAGASAVKKSPNRLQIVKGSVLIRAQEQLTVHALYSSSVIESGVVLIEVKDNRMRMTNLTGVIRYRPRGAATDLELPKGLMNDLAPVTMSGQAQVSYPRSMNLRPLMQTWAKFFKKSEFEVFKADFERFLPHWRAGLDFIGPWYRENIAREIADHRAELERQRRLRAEREREANYYREMFRRKNFLD